MEWAREEGSSEKFIELVEPFKETMAVWRANRMSTEEERVLKRSECVLVTKSGGIAFLRRLTPAAVARPGRICPSVTRA